LRITSATAKKRRPNLKNPPLDFPQMRGEPALNGANSHHKHTPITESPSHFGFWIADFRLSERDFEGNAFIGLFSWLSIQNLKSKIQNVT
jgi:hypothetical protein